LTGIEDVVTVTSGSSAVVRGRLRVNVDAFFSRLMFAPHVSEFLSLHPDLSLDLIAKDQLGDLVGDGFDVAVRFGAPPDSSLMAKKLLETRTVTVASPAYLEARGRPAAPSDLVNHSCIQVRDSLTGQPIKEWQFRREGKVVQIRTAGRLMVAEFGTMLTACLGGFGIARVESDWRAKLHPTRRPGRTSLRVVGRKLPAVCAVPVGPPARCQGARLHRLYSVARRGGRWHG
jgi:DNA-binding transcriptional LysR family regulator